MPTYPDLSGYTAPRGNYPLYANKMELGKFGGKSNTYNAAGRRSTFFDPVTYPYDSTGIPTAPTTGVGSAAGLLPPMPLPGANPAQGAIPHGSVVQQGLMQLLPGLLGYSSNPYAAAGMFAAQQILPQILPSLFGNPEADRARELREQSVAELENILPSLRAQAAGEVPEAVREAIANRANATAQAASVSSTRQGIGGTALSSAQQMRADRQTQDALTEYTARAQPQAVRDLAGISDRLALRGEQYALAGTKVDADKGAIATSIAGLMQKPDDELSAAMKALSQSGVNIQEFLESLIESGILTPSATA